MIFLLGPAVTANSFAWILNWISKTPVEVSGFAAANVDSEMRFYSVLWFAYGALALWVSRSLSARLIWLRLMLLIFFIGGIGRLISHVSVGAPHPLFSVLMWIELLLPTLLLPLSYLAPRRDDAKSET